MPNIMQLKITLRDSQPPIWRRIKIKDNISFHKLHEIFQVVMGWTNSHLYDFQVDGQRLSVPKYFDWDDKLMDSRKIRISTLKPSQKFDYTYDFGDCWEHQIIVEKIEPNEMGLPHPVCIKGKLSCPPDDCGGIGGYYRLLHVRRNKNHPEYKELIKEWLGEDFDPNYFEIEEINKELMERFIDGRTRYWVIEK
ncbi:plasmid pRiA4b ORF-3 family protein [Candidatus Woesearchaeota archaeon]|nr:plasmid pRiA4b ORF-3 family protein [Candidatus Woesearchaeota archaeon]